MIVVIDSSAALELALGRAGNKKVAAVLKDARLIAAPSLYLYEIANAMWKYYNFESLSMDVVKKTLTDCGSLVTEFIPASLLFQEACAIACEIKHPVYDAAYLVACNQKKAVLLTLDQRLKKAARDLGIVCY